MRIIEESSFEVPGLSALPISYRAQSASTHKHAQARAAHANTHTFMHVPTVDSIRVQVEPPAYTKTPEEKAEDRLFEGFCEGPGHGKHHSPDRAERVRSSELMRDDV